MTAKPRLDAELVRRGLARSRDHARELVAAGRVRIGGLVAAKPATGVDPAAALLVAPAPDGNDDYVSRGGHKLAGALDTFDGVVVEGRRALDAGASTGGFTDVLLRRGASEVVAADVGYGQLDWRVRNDARVRVLERTNVRTLTPDAIGGTVALVVADLSFISLTVVLPALAACADTGADFVLMVKPQFEAGRERVGAGGVVRDPELRAETIATVVAAAADLGLHLVDVVASPLPGPSGNVEYFVWLSRTAEPLTYEAVTQRIERAVAEGPR